LALANGLGHFFIGLTYNSLFKSRIWPSWKKFWTTVKVSLSADVTSLTYQLMLQVWPISWCYKFDLSADVTSLTYQLMLQASSISWYFITRRFPYTDINGSLLHRITAKFIQLFLLFRGENSIQLWAILLFLLMITLQKSDYLPPYDYITKIWLSSSLWLHYKNLIIFFLMITLQKSYLPPYDYITKIWLSSSLWLYYKNLIIFLLMITLQKSYLAPYDYITKILLSSSHQYHVLHIIVFQIQFSFSSIQNMTSRQL
jgi:hypothetical protein